MSKCQCGCGQPTRIAPVNDASKGWIKGQHLKFVKGHSMGKAVQTRSARTIGNKSLSTHGYVVVNMGHGERAYEHVLVAEKALGRSLVNYGQGNPRTEVVHHITGDKTDNRAENLLICSHKYHTELHHRLEASSLWPEFSKIQRRSSGEGYSK